MFNKSAISLALLMIPTWAYASDTITAQHNLDTVEVKAQRIKQHTLPLNEANKAMNILIKKEKLQQRSGLLGDALADEPGIHGNPFGGGASAPVVRGQEGVRLKILQNHLESVDMSHLSPDHTIAVDTLLAEQVDVIRGPSTLVYGSASPAGVINVIDKRIPERVPTKGWEGEVSSRLNSNSKEKMLTGGMTVGLGEHFALRAEGLTRHADNYNVPEFKGTDKTFDYLPDSYNRSHVGTIGGSISGSKGFLGAAYSTRSDRYGIPGHNHCFDSASAHIFDDLDEQKAWYVRLYPHLMDEAVLVKHAHFHGCDGSADSHKDHPSLSHTHGHTHTGGAGPWIEMRSKRSDLRGEWKEPFSGVEKIRLAFANSDYYHDEKDDTNPVNIFKNKGKNAKLEIFHQPIGNLKGMFGVQYQTQTSSASVPKLPPPCTRDDKPECQAKNYPKIISELDRRKWALIENKDSRLGFFLAEQFKWRDFTFEAAARTEKQTIDIDYDRKWLADARASAAGGKPSFLDELLCNGNQKCLAELTKPKPVRDPDLSPYRKRANSYAAAVHWHMTPQYILSLSAGHYERVPSPMELYYHGSHLATNSFEHGNKNLDKERSNNIDVSLAYNGDRLRYQFNAYYNRFKNRIFNQTLARSGYLTLNRYTQSRAKYYGFEGKIDYDITPDTTIGVFGDYVRGKLSGLPKTSALAPKDDKNNVYVDITHPDQNAPRVPPTRLGLRINTQFNDHWSGSFDYTRVFAQRKTMPLELPTRGYHLVNLGVAYRNKSKGYEYKLFANAQNILNQKIYIHQSAMPYVPQMGRNFNLGASLRF